MYHGKSGELMEHLSEIDKLKEKVKRLQKIGNEWLDKHQQLEIDIINLKEELRQVTKAFNYLYNRIEELPIPYSEKWAKKHKHVEMVAKSLKKRDKK